MSGVSAVLPTLDEAGSVAAVLEGLFAAVEGLDEAIVVDDGSADGTPEAVEAFAARTGRRAAVVRRRGRPGLTESLREGFSRARGDIVLWLDADGAMPAEAASRLVARVRGGCDLAIGSRFVPGGRDKLGGASLGRDSALAAALSRGLNGLLRRLCGPGVTDYTSGFAAARREVLARFPPEGRHGEYFILLAARAARAGLRVVEEPYAIRCRESGRSKSAGGLGLLRRGPAYLAAAARAAAERRAS